MADSNRGVSLEEILCFDTETTGVVPGSEILQLSMMDGRGEVLFDEYIRPVRAKEWPGAERVHHISPEMVADKESMDFHRSRIEEILENARIYVGYNVLFDIKMLKYAGFSMDPFHRNEVRVIDVMRNFAPVYGDWNPAKNSYRWQKLETCAAYYEYDWGNEKAHGALADTRATLYCFKRMNQLL